MKVIDSNSGITGVHMLNDQVRADLLAKHPEGKDAVTNADIYDIPHVQEVHFEDITSESIISSAKNTHGSGGPTKISADIWKKMLCSNVFKDCSVNLAEEVATLARKLCVKDIPFECISTLVACRLVPLMKEDNGIRPIGIGEVLRRIVGKSISKVVEDDIQSACGNIQTCSGVKCGIDSAVPCTEESVR